MKGSIQQKGINFDLMMSRVYSITRTILLCFLFHSTVLGQVNPELYDLGVFSGELRVASRTLDLKGHLFQKHVEISSSNIELKYLKYDSLNDNSSIDLVIKLNERKGEFVDTLSFYNMEGLLLKTIHVEYKILDPVGDVFKSYRNEFWPFKAKEQVFNLKVGVLGDTLRASFNLYNFSGHPIDLTKVIISDSIKVHFEPKEISHNAFTRMNLQMITSDTSELGFNKEQIILLQNKDTLSFLPIQYSLLPKPSVSKAQMDITRDNFDYKVVSEGDVISEVVFISNIGKEPLEIYKIETNCECLKAQMSSYKVFPDQNAQLRIKFDTNERGGLERKIITLFTNDPQTPTRDIIIKAHVK